MRLLEILLLVLASIECAKHFWPAKIQWRFLAYLPRLLVVLFLAHLLFEGARWSLFPLYALVMWSFVTKESTFLRPRFRVFAPKSGLGRAFKLAGAGSGLILVALSGFVASSFPVFSYPRPTGPEAVGYAVFELVDASRPETLGDSGQPRTFSVHVWYPAAPAADAKPRPFATLAEARALIKAKGYSIGDDKGRFGFIGDHFPLIKTYSYENAPPARGGPYPVLLYNHGYMPGEAMDAQTLTGEIASHGYVVVSISHPYESGVSFRPKGNPIFGDRSHTDVVNAELAAIINKKLITPPMTTHEERVRLQTELEDETPLFSEVIRRWTADTVFALDKLEEWSRDNSHSLSSILDIERIGVFGLSNGGAVATRFCAIDHRCVAGINYDGFVFGAPERAITVPFMMVYSDTPGNQGMNDFVFDKAQGDIYTLYIDNSRHADFTTSPFVAPILKGSPIIGQIGGPDMHKVTAAFTRAFFDQYIKGMTAPELHMVQRDLFSHVRFSFSSRPEERAQKSPSSDIYVSTSSGATDE